MVRERLTGNSLNLNNCNLLRLLSLMDIHKHEYKALGMTVST